MSILFLNTVIAETLRPDCTIINLHKEKMGNKIKYHIGADKTSCLDPQTACAEIALRL